MRRIAVKVNGSRYSHDVDERRLLSDFWSHDLGLRGSKVGCEHGVCGACTVRLDGAAVRSCLLLAVHQVDGCRIDTVEGLAGRPDGLHPLEEALHRYHDPQCSDCTAGILMTAAEMDDEPGTHSVQDIKERLYGQISRCTGFNGIVAVLSEAVGS